MSSRLRKIQHRARHRERMARDSTSPARVYFTTRVYTRTMTGSAAQIALTATGLNLAAAARHFGIHRGVVGMNAHGGMVFWGRDETDDELRERIWTAYLALPEERRG